jgi:hypothetical protein
LLSERPKPVTLDDLAEPHFPDEVQPVIQMMAEAGANLVLAPEPLMAAAVAETGLEDFGPADFVERLDVLCRSFTTDIDPSPAGVAGLHGMLTGLLRNRLLIEDLIKRHPEILQVPIQAPIVICGLPRTGTTHLHNLMSADRALRALPYWECLQPVLPDGEQPPPGEPDPRWVRTDQALNFTNSAMPYFKRMHEMTADHVHEEIQLLAIDFSTMLFETVAPLSTWRDYYMAHDQRSSYAYMKKVLQVLQWLRGGTRWVLKSPQHIEQFPALYETFPDGTFVLTHRDPVSVTVSLSTMVAYSARMNRSRVDVKGVGRYWSDRIERMLRSCVEHREVLPADRSLDVRFDEFMRDDIAMVTRIYELAGQPMTDGARAAMGQFMADHPRGRHGSVRYDPAVLGIDREERRRALAFYTERFGITEEAGD